MTFTSRVRFPHSFAALLAVACLAAIVTALACSAQAAETHPVLAPGAHSAAPQQAYTLPPDKLAKAIALGRIRNVLDIAGSLWGIAFLWLLLASHAATGLENWAQHLSRHRWVQGLAFFAVFLIAVTIAGFPLDWIGQLAERSYGISVQGWGSWLCDEAKSLGVTLLIGAPILLLFNWIVRRWPRRYWLGAWIVTVPLTVLSVFAQPILAPLFDKFEPLEKTNPALVEQLERVVARTGTHIPPSRMFLMKASLKTNGLNAYVTGFGPTKRIVVWDTTAGRIPNDEILFIFGHETGHYVLHHLMKGLAISAVGLFFLYWACAGLAAWMARRLGPRWRLGGSDNAAPFPGTRAGFVVLLFVLSIAGFFTEPVANAVSRHFEHQADIYGQEAIHGIVPDPQKTAVAAFDALGETWLEDPHPNPLIEFWLYSHPSVEQRANFAAHYDPWKNGGHGKYFSR